MESMFDKLAEANLDDVNTEYPILAPGTYEFKIDSATKEDSASGGEYLLFICSLVSPDANDVNGEPVQPGYKMRYMINMTPSEKQIAQKGQDQCEKDIYKDVCRFLDAIQGHRAFDPTLESYIGMQFFCKTKVGKERTNENTGEVYPPQTEFGTPIPKDSAPDATDTTNAPY